MMNETSKVSIIVPVYNIELYITKCVNSLINQTYKNIEIILVDDGSSDKSPVICDDFGSEDDRIIAIHKSNEGASFARKTGLSAATGDYIMFVDGDDWIDENTVSECLKVMYRDKADCVIFGYVREYPNKSIPNRLFDHDFSYDLAKSEELIHKRIIGPSGKQLREPHRLDNLSSCCMRLMTSSVAKNGRFVSDKIVGTSEDTVFNIYALEKCRISYIDRYFYHYRKNNQSSLTTSYKSDLCEKWDVLYQVMQEYINNSGYKDQYSLLLSNRIACGMIGLGLNELQSPDNDFAKARKLKAILKKPHYEKSISQLDISQCDMKWKVFFILCKKRATLLLVFLLRVMNYLRSHSTS